MHSLAILVLLTTIGASLFTTSVFLGGIAKWPLKITGGICLVAAGSLAGYLAGGA